MRTHLVIGRLNEYQFFSAFHWSTSDTPPTPPPLHQRTVTNVENIVWAVHSCNSWFSSFLLCTASKKLYHFQGLFVIIKEIFSKFQDNSRTYYTFFRIRGVFQDQGHFPGLFKVCANTVIGQAQIKQAVLSMRRSCLMVLLWSSITD